MKIISHKSDSYSTTLFLKNAYNSPYIDGVNIDIIMTKDKKVVVFNPISNNNSILNIIKNNYLEDLKTLDILTLEKALSILNNSNKRIVINFSPIYVGGITESNLETIKGINKNYVDQVLSIVNDYKNLDIYLCSMDQSIIYFLKKFRDTKKIGLIVSPDNSFYINIDFYVLMPSMIDNKIINEQLSNNKKIMIFISNCNDMNIVNSIYNKETMTIEEKNIFEQLWFINNYPDIFYKIYR